LRPAKLVTRLTRIRNTTTHHALLSIAEEIINSVDGTNAYSLAKEKFHGVLDCVGELQKYWPAASLCYNMYSILALDEFKALKISAENARSHSRQEHTVSSLDHVQPQAREIALLPGFSLFDQLLYMNDSAPFAFDQWSDWQNMDFDEQLYNYSQ
jgi:hypothetical protein